MRRKDLTRMLTAFLAAGVIVTSSVPVTVQNVYADAYQYTIGDSTLTYKLSGKDEVVITGYTGEDITLVIPEEIDGKKVTAIGENAFYGVKDIMQVSIPASVVEIGASAFTNCNNLIRVNIPSNSKLTTIKHSAFSDCSGLVEIVIPESVISIDNYVFSYCNSLTKVTIPSNVTKLGLGAFYGCEKLRTVVLSSKLKTKPFHIAKN